MTGSPHTGECRGPGGCGNCPRGLIGYLLLVETAAFAATVFAFIAFPPATASLIPFSALLAGMLCGAEFSRPVERSRADTRLGAGMDTAWIFAGALLLPPGLVAALVVASSVHRWFRIRRGVPHRQVFAAATRALAAVAAALVPVVVGAASFSETARDFPTFALAFGAGVVFLAVDAALAALANESGAGPSGFAFDAAMVAFGLVLAWSAVDWPFAAVLLAAALVVLPRAGLARGSRGHAGTDSGTGLLTASSWLDGAHTQFDLLRRRGSELSLLMLDLDHFAWLNDEHGRHVGDDVLRAVADTLRAEVRSADLVGRFGGEEFVGKHTHPAHVFGRRRDQFRNLGGPDVVLEPETVDFGVPDALTLRIGHGRHTDVFEPQLGMLFDELGHQRGARRIVEQGDLHAVLLEPAVPAFEGGGLADDHPADAELAYQSAAVPAGGEGGDHDRVPVMRPPARVAERGGLRVHRRVAVLHPAVVPAAQQDAVRVEQGGTDRDPALGLAEFGFFAGDGQQFPGIDHVVTFTGLRRPGKPPVGRGPKLSAMSARLPLMMRANR